MTIKYNTELRKQSEIGFLTPVASVCMHYTQEIKCVRCCVNNFFLFLFLNTTWNYSNWKMCSISISVHLSCNEIISSYNRERQRNLRLDRYSTALYQYQYPHIRIRIKMGQVEKRWGYSCRPYQDPHIRIRKQYPEKMDHWAIFPDADDIRTSHGKIRNREVICFYTDNLTQ